MWPLTLGRHVLTAAAPLFARCYTGHRTQSAGLVRLSAENSTPQRQKQCMLLGHLPRSGPFFQRLPVSPSSSATRPPGRVGQPPANLAPLAHLQSTAAPRPSRKNPGGEEENQRPASRHGDSTPRPRAKPAARSRLGRHHVNTACSAGRGGR